MTKDRAPYLAAAVSCVPGGRGRAARAAEAGRRGRRGGQRLTHRPVAGRFPAGPAASPPPPRGGAHCGPERRHVAAAAAGSASPPRGGHGGTPGRARPAPRACPRLPGTPGPLNQPRGAKRGAGACDLPGAALCARDWRTRPGIASRGRQRYSRWRCTAASALCLPAKDTG